MLAFSTYNDKVEKKKKLSRYNAEKSKNEIFLINSVTGSSFQYTAYFKSLEKEILSQQIEVVEKSIRGKMLQIIAIELLSLGILVPDHISTDEMDYLSSLILTSKSQYGTFFSRPFISKRDILGFETKNDRVIFLGIPYDIGSSRPGTRYGPRVLRAESNGMLFRGYDSKLLSLLSECDVFQGYELYDAGDIYLDNINKKFFLERIRDIISNIFGCSIPFCIGGDHLFTLPILEGIAKSRGNSDFTLVQIDYHLDIQTWGNFENKSPSKLSDPTHANFISWIKETLPEIKIYQIGVGDYVNVGTGISTDDFLSYLNRVSSRITNLEIYGSDYLSKLPKGEEVYLTIDVDALNRVYLPNTGYPSAFGLDLGDFLNIINYICFHNQIIGIDIMEFGESYNIENQSPMSEIVLYIILQILQRIKK